MKRFFLLLVLLVIFFYFLVDKYFIIDEKRKIKKIIYEAKAACENEDLKRVGQILHKDYQDNFGHNYENLLIKLNSIFSQYDHIKIYFLKERVEVNNSLAICTLSVRAIGLAVGVEEYQVVYRDLIVLYLKKNKDWYIYYAK